MALFDFNLVAEKYDQFYDTPFGLKVDHVERQAIWECLLQTELNEPFLEIGCGTGHWTRFFRQKGLNITAIDEADKMLAIAKVKNPDRVDFSQMSAENMQFPDHTFLNIITIATLEFVDNLDDVLSEINRVLSPGGTLIAGCLNENSEPGREKQKNEVYRNARFFTPEGLQESLKPIGSAKIDACAMIEGDKVLDYPDFHQVSRAERMKKGAFLTAIVKKEKS